MDVEKTAEREVGEKRHSLASGTTGGEEAELQQLGYTPELTRTRNLKTLTFQSLAIAAIPYGEGGPLISGIYGGGQLSIFVGWILVLVLSQCVAMSLAEIASLYPTSGGPPYWAYQLAKANKPLLSYVTGWIWVIGNWTITLSVNFGFASMISALITINQPDVTLAAWQLLLVFYLILLITYLVVIFGNKVLPIVDTVCAAWTALTIFVILIALSVTAKAGRHSAKDALGAYDKGISGWGNFTFFIGLLPAAYTFSAIGMISSMSEEVRDPSIKLPRAISLCVPVGGIAGLFYVIPICVVLPPLEDIINNAPIGQALPYVFYRAMGSSAGAIGLIFLVLLVTFFCCVSITTCASRTTWAFARDRAVPGSKLFRKTTHGVPVAALSLVTIIQALLGLINLGSSSTFLAFTSAGVMGLALAYGVCIAVSVLDGRRKVSGARWNLGPVIGPIVNGVALLWIAFEMFLFSMPSALPVTAVSMNYASVIVVGFMFLSAVWYLIHARRVYKGPPDSEGIYQ